MTGVVFVVAFAVVMLVWMRGQRGRQLARLADLIRYARRLATMEITYRPYSPGEQLGFEPPDLDAIARELPADFVVLGDLVEQPAGQPASGVLRWFRDADATTFGWLSRLRGHSGAVLVGMLMTNTDDDSYLTRFGPVQGATPAAPPFAHRLDPDYSAGFAAAIAAHRGFAPRGGVRVTSVPDLLAELARTRSRAIAWRTAQPPDALLDLDLRAFLGDRYDELHADLAKRLAVDLPKARAV